MIISLFTEAHSITKRECSCVREVPPRNNVLCQFNPVPISSYLVPTDIFQFQPYVFKRKTVPSLNCFRLRFCSQVPFPSCVLCGQAM